MEDAGRRLYGLLFHPEVAHTQHGADMLRRFAYGVCGCRGDWTMGPFVDEAVARIRSQVGDGRVICALSGGVDSTVAALLMHRAIGDRLTCVFVDNGVLRLDEAAQVKRRLADKYQLPRRVRRRVRRGSSRRSRASPTPKQKRKIIGAAVHRGVRGGGRPARGLRLPRRRARSIPTSSSRSRWSARRRRSRATTTSAACPRRMRLKLVEPLRQLFKDEVRALGRATRPRRGVRGAAAVPRARARRPHPRRGDARPARPAAARRRGRRGRDQAARAGTAGCGRASRCCCRCRASASWATSAPTIHHRHPRGREPRRHDGRLGAAAARPARHASRRGSSTRSRGINRVVYDISSKPPSTIEWE